MKILSASKLSILLIMLPSLSQAVMKSMTDEEVRKLIVNGEISSYQGECLCPYSMVKGADASAQQQCGDNSEYMKAEQRGLIHCFVEDVTDSEVYNYRASRNIPDPNKPCQIFPGSR